MGIYILSMALFVNQKKVRKKLMNTYGPFCCSPPLKKCFHTDLYISLCHYLAKVCGLSN